MNENKNSQTKYLKPGTRFGDTRRSRTHTGHEIASRAPKAELGRGWDKSNTRLVTEIGAGVLLGTGLVATAVVGDAKPREVVPIVESSGNGNLDTSHNVNNRLDSAIGDDMPPVVIGPEFFEADQKTDAVPGVEPKERA